MRGIGLGGCEQVRERRAGPRRGQRDRSERHERGATAARGTRIGVRASGGGGGGGGRRSIGKRRGGRTSEHREVVLVLGDQLRVLRQVERGGGGGGLHGGTHAAEVALLEVDRVDHVESALAFTSSLRVRRQRDARKQCACSGGLGLCARTRLLLF